MWIKKLIKKRLKNYREKVYTADRSLADHCTQYIRVAVVGSGLAGISAAANLAEKGFKVDLFEKESQLGGKLAAWESLDNGRLLKIEHGFHAFFKQYYNCRDFLQKIGASTHLKAIDDYVILFKNHRKIGFNDLNKTPVLNILSLHKKGFYKFKDFIPQFRFLKMLDFLRFDMEKTYQKYDGISFAEFDKMMKFQSEMHLVFNTFARAFFSDPEDISSAELMKGFHYYFLSDDQGLLYDVLDDHFEESLFKYVKAFFKKHQVNVFCNKPVFNIRREHNGFKLFDTYYDEVVLATDVKGLKEIRFQGSDYEESEFTRIRTAIPSTKGYAVLKIWIKAKADIEMPFFIFTDRLKILDSITIYHQMESSFEVLYNEAGLACFELHSYALPKDLTHHRQIRHQLLVEFFHYFPEFQNSEICHEHLQVRNDFPSFAVNLRNKRPRIETAINGLYLSGDWVKLDFPAMLMEAAYSSGALAANKIMKKYGVQENDLYSTARKGVLV